MAIKIIPKGLDGIIDIPSSKSISHRAIIAGALSSGESVIENVILSKDIEATCRGLSSLGTDIQIISCEEDRHKIIIKGKGRLESKESTIDCIESGSTLRFLIPLAPLTGESITFEGSGRLVERPLDIYYKIFDTQGIKYKNSFGKLPLTLCGKLKPDNFYVRGDISSQFITGLMYALPLLEGDSQIILETPLQSKGYVDLTIDVLKSFEIIIENNNYNSFKIQGKQSYMPRKFTVEGDFSQAAFWLAGGVLSGTTVSQGLNMDSLQGDREITRIIQAMGGNLKIKNNGVTAHKSELKGIEIDASQIPDLVPIISVIASLSKGRTIIKNAGRLRIKESDRLRAIASELNKIGGKIVEQDEGLVIEGVNSFGGGIVDSWNDHRIAMALAIAAARCKDPLIITGEKSVNKSYPRFWEDFKKLGGEIHEWNMGE